MVIIKLKRLKANTIIYFDVFLNLLTCKIKIILPKMEFKVFIKDFSKVLADQQELCVMYLISKNNLNLINFVKFQINIIQLNKLQNRSNSSYIKKSDIYQLFYQLININYIKYSTMLMNKKLQLFDQQQEQQPKLIKNPIPKKAQNQDIQQKLSEVNLTFSDFSLHQKIVTALNLMGYTKPTKIQEKSLQIAIQTNKDLLCLSQTGSGKTLSFILPIINKLMNEPLNRQLTQGFALILSPTRQLSLQTKQYFDRFEANGVGAWGTTILYGGVDPMKQVIQISKKPAVIIATPGRILHHLQNTKGFNLNNLKYLVLDEADKLLNMDFQKQINQILDLIPKQRISFLYSATMTSKVNKLQRISLRDPSKIQLSQKYHTVEKLEQHYIFMPAKYKDCYLVYLLYKMKNKITIVYVKTCLTAIRIALTIKDMNFKVACLHGQMTQKTRQANLQKFRKGQKNILISTDVSSRGIDINNVQLVINYDMPNPKDYIHRVGRTARMGKSGLALNLVNQYDVQQFQKIQKCLGQTLTQYQIKQQDVLVFKERVQQSQRQTSKKMRETKNKVDINQEDDTKVKGKKYW